MNTSYAINNNQSHDPEKCRIATFQLTSQDKGFSLDNKIKEITAGVNLWFESTPLHPYQQQWPHEHPPHPKWIGNT